MPPPNRRRATVKVSGFNRSGTSVRIATESLLKRLGNASRWTSATDPSARLNVISRLSMGMTGVPAAALVQPLRLNAARPARSGPVTAAPPRGAQAHRRGGGGRGEEQKFPPPGVVGRHRAPAPEGKGPRKPTRALRERQAPPPPTPVFPSHGRNTPPPYPSSVANP